LNSASREPFQLSCTAPRTSTPVKRCSSVVLAIIGDPQRNHVLPDILH
jgi:hypothetical protein